MIIDYKLKFYSLLIVCLILILLSCDTRTVDSLPQPPENEEYADVTDNYPVLHSCEIPDGYVYPEATAQYYIEQGIALQEDFVRPDLIWRYCNEREFITVEPGTVWLAYDYWTGIKDPDAKFAVTVTAYNGLFQNTQALSDYLTGLGWENTTLTKAYSTVEYPVFAATRTQIESLDCTSLQTFMGSSTEGGIAVLSVGQEYHRHSEPLPVNHFWKCSFHIDPLNSAESHPQ